MAHTKLRGKICIDCEEKSIQKLSLFMKGLEKIGMTTQILRKIDDAEISQCKIMVLGLRKDYKYLESEIKVIIDYLVRGGTLLVLYDYLSECMCKSNIKDITDILGIYSRCIPIWESREKKDLIISFIKESNHAITRNIEELHIPQPSSFVVKKRPFTEVILRAPESTNLASTPIAIATRYGNGKIVIIGSEKIFYDEWIKKGDNAVFFLNIIAWLTGVEIEEKDKENIIAEIKGLAKVKEEKVIEKVPPSHERRFPLIAIKKETEVVREEPIKKISQLEKLEKVPVSIEKERLELLTEVTKRLAVFDTKIQLLLNKLENLESKMNTIVASLMSVTGTFNKLLKNFERMDREVIDVLKENTEAILSILTKLKLIEELISKGID